MNGAVSVNYVTIIITALLAFNTLAVSLSAWFLKRYVERNDKDHDYFFKRGNAHETRISVIEADKE
jgi:hypothetical protein